MSLLITHYLNNSFSNAHTLSHSIHAGKFTVTTSTLWWGTAQELFRMAHLRKHVYMSVLKSEKRAAFLLNQLSMELFLARQFCEMIFRAWVVGRPKNYTGLSSKFSLRDYIGSAQGNLCCDRINWNGHMPSKVYTHLLQYHADIKTQTFFQVWEYPSLVVLKTHFSTWECEK